MSWRKEQRRAERGYHHGNLKEALLQAALGLIARKGRGRVHLCRRRAHGRRQPRGAVPAFSRPRRTAFQHRAARLRAVRGAADPGLGRWPSGHRHGVRAGRQSLSRLRPRRSRRSIRRCSNQGFPSTLNPTLLAASERAFGIIRAAAERLAALAPPGMPRPPAMMMALHIWSMSHGVASLFGRGDAARRKLPMSAGGPAGSRSADLSARSRLPDRPPAVRPEDQADQKPPVPPPVPPSGPWGTPK